MAFVVSLHSHDDLPDEDAIVRGTVAFKDCSCKLESALIWINLSMCPSCRHRQRPSDSRIRILRLSTHPASRSCFWNAEIRDSASESLSAKGVSTPMRRTRSP